MRTIKGRVQFHPSEVPGIPLQMRAMGWEVMDVLGRNRPPRAAQTPPDLVVKYQLVDIAGAILWLVLWPRGVDQRKIKGCTALNM